MNKYENLIRRARELAALTTGATPGPWDCSNYVLRQTSSLYKIASFDEAPDDEEAKLIAAAPEMARLLAEMANALEKKEVDDDLKTIRWCKG